MEFDEFLSGYKPTTPTRHTPNPKDVFLNFR